MNLNLVISIIKGMSIGCKSWRHDLWTTLKIRDDDEKNLFIEY